tara:strand:+ start:59768 stop:60187 length:420 start_codon:yes stop_codon:yes gene_type:complete
MNELNLPTEIHFDQDGHLSQQPAGVGCPNCRGPLQIGLVQGQQMAGCPICLGMLMQQETFAALIKQLRLANGAKSEIPKPMDASQLDVRRHCPACDTVFDTHPYAGPGNSVIDTCTECHLVWFDRGELDKLVTAPGRRV